MKTTLEALDRATLRGRTVLVRADLNAPMDDGRITDDQRLEASIPTLRLLIDSGARVVLLSHLGRPKGEAVPEFTLEPVSRRLAELLGHPVAFVSEPVGDEAASRVSALQDGEVVLLQNTRYLPGETANAPELSASWAAMGDLFVNDAFGAAHRAHASTAGLAGAVRARGGQAVAGLLMARELRFLQDALETPERPFVAILGGAKISGKIDVISALLPRVDQLLIGGAMANTFLKALGHDTGDSLVEDDRVAMAGELMDAAGDKLVLPTDCVVSDRIAPDAVTRVASLADVTAGEMIADIGPESIARYTGFVSGARTIVWNGPMGVFEMPPFAAGTMAVAEAVAEACGRGALGVLGGGDSAAAAEQAGVVDRLTHVSTGGGASLELLAGSVLPGVDSLSDQEV